MVKALLVLLCIALTSSACGESAAPGDASTGDDQADGYDLGRLTNGVRFEDNDINWS